MGHTDGINLLGDKINTTKENVQTLLEASRDVGKIQRSDVDQQTSHTFICIP
jgi:hypothetical protein